ncbi:MAG: patatin-like phospholipase family protein [Gammaproteobacteria bacterium]|nr:patatin-like phospholipase family protein [Gammaproteobacteria bacterium]
MTNRNNKEFILALGGGGGRGLAHLGVIQALEEHDLKPTAIVGTSIGALFGGMYALTGSIEIVIERVRVVLTSEAFSHLELPHLTEAETTDHTWLGKLTAAARESVLYTRAATGSFLTDSAALLDIINNLCDGKGFADLKIGLHITSVRFPSGETEIFSRGDLTKVIAASMAIPGVFEPININEQFFVDGGLACELPAKEAKMIAKPEQLVVAVDVGARPNPNKKPDTVIGMLDWAIRIKAYYLRQYKAQYADLIIDPMPGFRQWNDFSHPDQEIERGRQSAMEQIPNLIEMLSA